MSTSVSLRCITTVDLVIIEISALSLHDALPIWPFKAPRRAVPPATAEELERLFADVERALAVREQPLQLLCRRGGDRKSTRLNSSHRCISYAVFCLKKKKNNVTKISSYLELVIV